MSKGNSGAPTVNLVVRMVVRTLSMHLIVIPPTAKHEVEKVDVYGLPLVVANGLTKILSFGGRETACDETRHEPRNFVFGGRCSRSGYKRLKVAPEHATSVEGRITK